MKVSELKYERVNIAEAEKSIRRIIKKVVEAESAEKLLALREETVKLSRHVQTMSSLAFIRFTLNTRDDFYLNEKQYYDESLPRLSALSAKFNRAFLSNVHAEEAFSQLNPNIKKLYNLSSRVSDEKIVPEMIEEAKLVTEYDILISGITFFFHGKRQPLSVMKKYFEDPDRDTRCEAMAVVGRGLQRKKAKIDEIFSKLVRVRAKMAEKLSFKSYADLGDGLMGRYSYGRDEIHKFRKQVVEKLVPVIVKLKRKTANALGIDQLMLYDYDVNLIAGAPAPKGNARELFKNAKIMYENIDEEMGEFFNSLLDAGAIDVYPKKGKWGGGYCTSIDEYKQPFILANFNGTSGDVDVLTHEMGHAFAYYEWFKQNLDYELNLGTMSVAEIHSMAMEMLAYPYADLFFERAEDYCYNHLINSLVFITYGCMVDEFEELCYSNLNWSAKDRNDCWLALESKYRPYLSSKGIPYFERGTRWQYQMHIFENPMYYIDYCLSQTIAHEIYIETAVDYKKALAKYLFIVKNGGELAFEELVEKAGFLSPFKEKTLEKISSKIIDLIDKNEQRFNNK